MQSLSDFVVPLETVKKLCIAPSHQLTQAIAETEKDRTKLALAVLYMQHPDPPIVELYQGGALFSSIFVLLLSNIANFPSSVRTVVFGRGKNRRQADTSPITQQQWVPKH